MDYNIENKGFVCFVYNLQRKRLFWLGLLGVLIAWMIISWIILKSSAMTADVLTVKLRFATIFVAIGVMTALVAPKTFLFKIIGYALIFLGVIFGIDYSNSDFTNVDKISFPFALPLEGFSFFTPDFVANNEPKFTAMFSMMNFIFFALFGAFCLVMMLSWFVYNARSSEINKI